MDTNSDSSKKMQAYFLYYAITVISVVVNHICFCCGQNVLSLCCPPSVRIVFFLWLKDARIVSVLPKI